MEATGIASQSLEASNGIATAAEIRQAAEAQAFEDPRKVMLPQSGWCVMLRRPRPVAFTLTNYGLPASLALKIQGADPVAATSDEEKRAATIMWIEMFGKMFVKPSLSLRPGPDQIHPNWLPDQDKVFLIRWAVGEVDDQNVSLAEFRRREQAVDAGAPGEAVVLPAVGPPVG
jgi:hypothetical protein